MNRPSKSKSLKDQNRWQLWLVIAANAAALCFVCQWNLISLSDTRTALLSAANLLPIGLAVVVTTVANGLLSSSMKDKLVFLRWSHVLPGHRAFSVYAKSDPRIDDSALRRALGNKLPSGPDAENAAWYRIYLEVQNVEAVRQAHRDFLLLRDYAGLAALFLICFGVAAAFAIPSTQTLLIYLAFLVLQLAVVRHAAATYGIRFMCTVLAQKAARPKK